MHLFEGIATLIHWNFGPLGVANYIEDLAETQAFLSLSFTSLEQASGKERQNKDQQFMQNISSQQISIDFTPEIASRIQDESTAKVATVAVCCTEAGQICLLADLPHQESYKDLVKDLVPMQARYIELQGQVKVKAVLKVLKMSVILRSNYIFNNFNFEAVSPNPDLFLMQGHMQRH